MTGFKIPEGRHSATTSVGDQNDGKWVKCKAQSYPFKSDPYAAEGEEAMAEIETVQSFEQGAGRSSTK